MNITEQITLLIGLQKLDGEIYRLTRRKVEIPTLLKKIDDDFTEKGGAMRKADDELKALILKQRDKENELAAKEETIKKNEGQLYQIKTNKEYTAKQQEIDGYKADKSVLEDDIIGILDELEARKQAVETAKAALKVEEQNAGAEKGRLNAELKEIEGRLATLGVEREKCASGIDKSMLSKYERVLRGKDGLAMVPVVNEACGGCHLNLPPQVINEIQMKENLIFCESCSRILYIE